jgi:hypothetical protein
MTIQITDQEIQSSEKLRDWANAYAQRQHNASNTDNALAWQEFSQGIDNVLEEAHSNGGKVSPYSVAINLTPVPDDAAGKLFEVSPSISANWTEADIAIDEMDAASRGYENYDHGQKVRQFQRDAKIHIGDNYMDVLNGYEVLTDIANQSAQAIRQQAQNFPATIPLRPNKPYLEEKIGSYSSGKDGTLLVPVIIAGENKEIIVEGCFPSGPFIPADHFKGKTVAFFGLYQNDDGHIGARFMMDCIATGQVKELAVLSTGKRGNPLRYEI